MSASFVYRHRVRYHEIDLQGHAYNARYLEYVDVAFTEFVRELGWDYEDGVALGFDPALVRAEIDFRRGARFDEVLEIAVRPLRMGETSLVLGFDVGIAGGERVADVVVIYANYDAAARRKREIPAPVRARLQPFLVVAEEEPGR